LKNNNYRLSPVGIGDGGVGGGGVGSFIVRTATLLSTEPAMLVTVTK
jgi:hypothetical protein